MAEVANIIAKIRDKNTDVEKWYRTVFRITDISFAHEISRYASTTLYGDLTFAPDSLSAADV